MQIYHGYICKQNDNISDGVPVKTYSGSFVYKCQQNNAIYDGVPVKTSSNSCVCICKQNISDCGQVVTNQITNPLGGPKTGSLTAMTLTSEGKPLKRIELQ